MMTTREIIVSICQNPGGATCEELKSKTGLEISYIGKCMPELVHQERLFVAKIAGCRLRWFGTAAEAMAYEQGNIMKKVEPPPKLQPKKNRPALSGKASSKKPPEIIVHTKDDISYATSHKIVFHPTPVDSRYTVASGDNIVGAGFRAIGIGYNVLTGKPWGEV